MSICNKSRNTYMDVRHQIQATVASGGRKGMGRVLAGLRLSTHVVQWIPTFPFYYSLCFYAHLKYFIMKNVLAIKDDFL